ncbi:hypothetical protein FEN17_09055 [Dyadobacter luticola]|uniref:Uncharacterized protein n=1 Tax=Dyadobacter luticola TaxID=1979387 RepID=A0A5R9L5R4_9BACT|nr:hypothetical protein FEN17_09055 [Dyadobacter luticola]
MPFSVITISIGILYAASLVISPARARPWLKRGGLLALIAGPVLLVTLIWAVKTADVGLRSVLENIHRATGLVSILVPVFFLINLIEESRLVADQQQAPPRVLRELLKVVAIFALILAGFGFASESARAIAPFRLTPEAIRQAKKFGAKNYVNDSGDTLRYKFVTPIDYDSTKRYPLIVCLVCCGYSYLRRRRCEVCFEISRYAGMGISWRPRPAGAGERHA